MLPMSSFRMFPLHITWKADFWKVSRKPHLEYSHGFLKIFEVRNKYQIITKVWNWPVTCKIIFDQDFRTTWGSDCLISNSRFPVCLTMLWKGVSDLLYCWSIGCSFILKYFLIRISKMRFRLKTLLIRISEKNEVQTDWFKIQYCLSVWPVRSTY